jgi:hypothetical protein
MPRIIVGNVEGGGRRGSGHGEERGVPPWGSVPNRPPPKDDGPVKRLLL